MIEFKEFYDLSVKALHISPLEVEYIIREFNQADSLNRGSVTKEELKIYVTKLYKQICEIFSNELNNLRNAPQVKGETLNLSTGNSLVPDSTKQISVNVPLDLSSNIINEKVDNSNLPEAKIELFPASLNEDRLEIIKSANYQIVSLNDAK